MANTFQVLAGAALLVVSSSAMAAADPAAGLQAMKELNLVVLGDMKGGHTVQGKTFVGGNLTNGGNFAVGNNSKALQPSGQSNLTVVGSTSGHINMSNGSNGGAGSMGTPGGVRVGGNLSNMNLNAQNMDVAVGGNISNFNGSSGSLVQVGGSRSGYVNANGGTVNLYQGTSFSQSLVSDLQNEATSMAANMNALSTALAGLQTNGSYFDFSDQNNVKLNAVDSGLGYAVVNVTDGQSLFNLARGLSFNIPLVDGNPLTTIINVSGSSAYQWMANPIGNMAEVSPYVIWNFTDATSLTLDRAVYGSVLAPNAVVTNRTMFEGTLVAKTFNQQGAVQLGAYNGANLFNNVPAVPEAGTWAMMIAGFGLVGAAMRRRRGEVRHVHA